MSYGSLLFDILEPVRSFYHLSRNPAALVRQISWRKELAK